VKTPRSVALFTLLLLIVTASQFAGARRASAGGGGSLFNNIGAGLTGTILGSVGWGDYNSDGKLDILLTGENSVSFPKLYENNGASFTENAGAGLTINGNGVAAWGDYNNDGRPDILITGRDISNNLATKLYRNNGDGTFTEDTSAHLSPVIGGPVAWGDYNNDGRQDIFLAGCTSSSCTSFVTKLYRNNGGGTFTEDTSAGLTGVIAFSAAWGDYDSDGNPDILLAGCNNVGSNCTSFVTKLFHNNGDGTFTEDAAAHLIGISGSVAWGDYNSDGRPDILLSGCTGMNSSQICIYRTTRVYRNDGGGHFTVLDIPLVGVNASSVAWGDYDNDGKPDILVTGENYSLGALVNLYHNNGNNTFTDEPGTGLDGVISGSVAWGDYDADGRLDIALTGSDSSSNMFANVYRNATPLSNGTPTAPTSLSSSVSVPLGISRTTLTWSAATDDTTPVAALSYNVRVGTKPGGSNIVSALALGSGRRLVPQTGNVGERTSFTLVGLAPGTYYWSVQAVDAGFVGSPFAVVKSFSIGKIFAHLTKMSFTPAQAGAVKLVYSFSSPSKTFGYVLSLKKGAKWLIVRRVEKAGTSEGSHSMTVKHIFGAKPIKAGRYRLKLSADANHILFAFKVVKSG